MITLYAYLKKKVKTNMNMNHTLFDCDNFPSTRDTFYHQINSHTSTSISHRFSHVNEHKIVKLPLGNKNLFNKM